MALKDKNIMSRERKGHFFHFEIAFVVHNITVMKQLITN